MPDYIPEIAHSDSGVHSLDTLSINSHDTSQSYPSYADQQLASERSETARQEANEAADEIAQQAKEFTRQAEEELSRLEKDSNKKYADFSAEAKSAYEDWKQKAEKEYTNAKKEASKDAKKVQKEAKKEKEFLAENRDNPVVVGNALVLTALGALLGVGAYRLQQRGELTWKVAGLWAGVVGLFGVGDYYVSQ